MNEEAEVLSRKARSAAEQLQWDAVLQIAERLIATVPEWSEGYFLKGLSYSAAKRPRLAIESFEKSLSLDQSRYDAAIELADQYAIALRNSEAVSLLEAHSGALANSPRYLNLAGMVYVNVGLPGKALPMFRQAYTLQPEIDLFKGNLASCCISSGLIEEAKNLYSELLIKNPLHQRNHYFLSRLEKAKDNKHIKDMESALESNPQEASRNIYMYYALAKEYEDLGDWDKAFEYYKNAGDAVCSVSNYSLSEDGELLNTIISTCDGKWVSDIDSAADISLSDQTPIFIVGLPRTGSTLIERIISNHSQVYSLDETQFIPMAVRKASRSKDRMQISSDIIRSSAKSNISDIRDEYLSAVRYRMSEGSYFIDKLPYNFLYLGFIAKAFPNAKLIYTHRNAMDTCFSMYKQVFTWAYKYSYSLDDLASYYVQHMRLLAHWKSVLGSRLIEFDYDKLVFDPEKQVKQLLAELGLSFEPACLDYHKSDKTSSTASSVQVRERIYNSSVRRWEKYRAHLKPLEETLNAAGLI